MTQQETAIQQLLYALKEDKEVRAVFLKGSIARGEQDEFSDVDLYCVVDRDKFTEFLPRRISYMESYMPLIYWSEANFVGPQIVGVYQDGLHLDLFTVSADAIPMKDAIEVLYDPEGLLQSYKGVTHRISEEELVRIVDGFTFSLLEFECAYKRGDLLWASRLGSHLTGDMSIIIRYIVNPDKAQLGFKRLYQELDDDLYQRWLTIMNNIGPSRLPDGVKLLVELSKEVLDELPASVLSQINMRFFTFMRERIQAL